MPFSKVLLRKETHCQRLERISRINGLRHAIFSIGKDKYIGEWKDNIKQGKGHYISRSDKLYEGDWDRNYRHGFGVLAQKDEKKIFRLEYRGNWKNGRFHGEGARHYPDGSYYLGMWKYGKRHGYGQMWYADGGFYDGDWVRDMRQGLGMLVKPDGNRYEGSWLKDMKHGKGRYFHLDSGQMQEGIWYEDVCSFSTVIDIPFRQTSSDPTYYPVKKVELLYPNEMIAVLEEKAMSSEKDNSCQTLRNSMIRNMGD